jgi:hypothetical protein
MKRAEINGEMVCICDPSCDGCDRRFRCLDAGVKLPAKANKKQEKAEDMNALAKAYKSTRDATLCNDAISNSEKIAILELIKQEILIEVQKNITCMEE